MVIKEVVEGVEKCEEKKEDRSIRERAKVCRLSLGSSFLLFTFSAPLFSLDSVALGSA
jgi:hypothetical protein